MFKKSIILGTLLVSTTFGSGAQESLDNDNSAAVTTRDLSWVEKEINEVCCILKDNFFRLDTTEYKESATRRVQDVFNFLKENPTITEPKPWVIGGIGDILNALGAKDNAIEVYKFELSLDPAVFGCEISETCFNLHKLGETAFAIKALLSLINNVDLEISKRECAVDCFYVIDTEGHRAEARKIWAQLQLEVGKFSSIEEASAVAATKFQTDEELDSEVEKASVREAEKVLAREAEEVRIRLEEIRTHIAKVRAHIDNEGAADASGDNVDYSDMPPLEN